jgi:hypothetical protein
MVLRKEVVAFFASLSTGWESIFKGSWYREGMFLASVTDDQGLSFWQL